MSLKPGIGALAVPDLAEVLTSSAGADSIIDTGDVPGVLRHGPKAHPLGRYLRRKIREQLGFPEVGCQPEILAAWKEQMSTMFKSSFEAAGIETSSPEVKRDIYKQILLSENEQKVRNIENKSKIFTKKGSI